jgi:tryptophan halogenase
MSIHAEPLKPANIVIVGGGTAGWMAAAFFSRVSHGALNIRVIESDAIGAVGVGEATIPSIQQFNKLLGIDEKTFLQKTQGTIKLGIEFCDWGSIGNRYLHAFGSIGSDIGLVNFYHYWLRARAAGDTSSLWDYSLNAKACEQNKFTPLHQLQHAPIDGFNHAYHFDASLYAAYLRDYATERGVSRTEGLIKTVQQADDGSIKALVMASGEVIDGDFYIDCSGFKALLIEQTLNAGYEDWSHWLPCDSAVAVGCERLATITPFTRSTAHTSGWQWRIPLQHRTGNGHVYSSKYMSDAEAAQVLLNHLDGAVIGEPRIIRFKTGVRKEIWKKNCVALGLASGFLEPLESTSIALIQHGLELLMKYFPSAKPSQPDIDDYNAHMRREYEMVRDFIILHYVQTDREDSPFWRYCKQMSVPERINHKRTLFSANARITRDNNELFGEMAWLQVMLGQGISPVGYHPLTVRLSDREIAELLGRVKQAVGNTVNSMLSHEQFLQTHQ